LRKKAPKPLSSQTCSDFGAEATEILGKVFWYLYNYIIFHKNLSRKDFDAKKVAILLLLAI